jgi:hypothetical protein
MIVGFFDRTKNLPVKTALTMNDLCKHGVAAPVENWAKDATTGWF